jgi:hypothetical protein
MAAAFDDPIFLPRGRHRGTLAMSIKLATVLRQEAAQLFQTQ